MKAPPINLEARLRGITAKLDRAETLHQLVQRRGDAWVSDERSWEIIPDPKPEKRRIIVSLRLVREAPIELSILLDEVVHHLSSALDLLATYLVLWSRGPEGRAEWPTVRTAEQWETDIDIPCGGPLAGADPSVRDFVRCHQPFSTGVDPDHDSLILLRDLWNAYKHRTLSPIRIQAKGEAAFSDLFHPTTEIEPTHFKWLLRPTAADELQRGSARKLALMEFSPDDPFPKVIMRGEIPLKVFVGSGDGTGGGSLWDDLARIRNIVRQATDKFPPQNCR
ncbi:MAG TPA: hypothetical protein VGH14_11655 [Solirubrobacterales bacterium]|jgi:hypothetical protein